MVRALVLSGLVTVGLAGLLACLEQVDGLDPAVFDAGIARDRCELARSDSIEDPIHYYASDGCIDYHVVAEQTPGFHLVDVCNRCSESRYIHAHRHRETLRDRSAELFTDSEFFMSGPTIVYGMALVAQGGEGPRYVAECEAIPELFSWGEIDQAFELPAGGGLTILNVLATSERYLDDRHRTGADLPYDVAPLDYRRPLELHVGLPRLWPEPLSGPAPRFDLVSRCLAAGLFREGGFGYEEPATPSLEEGLRSLVVPESNFPPWLKATVQNRRAAE